MAAPGMKAVGRVAPVGLAVVLLSLAGFTLWAITSIQIAGDRGRTAARANDAYQQARVALTEQRAALFQYLVVPDATERAAFLSANTSLMTQLALANDSSDDQAFISRILVLQRRYQRAAHQLFAKLDHGNQAQAPAIERMRIDPVLTRLTQSVDEGAANGHIEAVAALDQQVRLEHGVRAVALVVFPIGLLLLALLGWLLRRYARTEAAAQEKQRVRLEEAALTDAITGLGNHRAFQEQFGLEVRRALRHSHALSLALIDLDDFKTVNDRHGHAHGDRVLAILATVLRGN